MLKFMIKSDAAVIPGGKLMNQTIDIDGRTISYSKIGTGPRPAVLLHGWAASKAWWRTIAEGLADTHTCYAPDLVGFGQSAKPAEREAFHIERQAEVIAALIERLQLAPVYLIGHSMGGMISVTVAHHYPHLVERLAVFDLVVTGRCGSFLRAGQLALRVPLAGRFLFALGHAMTQRTLRIYRYSFKSMLKRKMGLEGEAIRAFIAQTYPDYRALPIRSFEFALRAFTGFDLRPFMAQVRQPTLVICGREDGQIPPEDSALLAKALPNSRIEWLSPAGHNPFVEYPDNCLTLLKNFANDVAGPNLWNGSQGNLLRLNGHNSMTGLGTVDKKPVRW
jgi:pimeloyl-ACP methyl ester carboxylesterase